VCCSVEKKSTGTTLPFTFTLTRTKIRGSKGILHRQHRTRRPPPSTLSTQTRRFMFEITCVWNVWQSFVNIRIRIINLCDTLTSRRLDEMESISPPICHEINRDCLDSIHDEGDVTESQQPAARVQECRFYDVNSHLSQFNPAKLL